MTASGPSLGPVVQNANVSGGLTPQVIPTAKSSLFALDLDAIGTRFTTEGFSNPDLATLFKHWG